MSFYDADEDGGDTGDDNDDGGGDNCLRIDDDLEDWMGGLPGLSSRGTQRVRRLAPRIFLLLLLLCLFLKSLPFKFHIIILKCKPMKISIEISK